MIINGPRKLRGSISVPGDKSITHRAFMLAALSHEISEIRNASCCIDCLSTERCLRALGAEFRRSGESVYIKGPLRPSEEILDAGNSGTTIRLLSGILAGKGFRSTITGDESLKRRPMKRIIRPLEKMGAIIKSDSGRAPISFMPSSLHGCRIIQEKPSAQVKSCILLASMNAEGESSYEESEITRDHLEKFLAKSYPSFSTDGGICRLEGGRVQKALNVSVPGDFSSAAFFITAAVISKNSEITIKGCGINPLRTGFMAALLRMGAEIELNNIGENEYGEPYADIKASSSRLKGISLEPEEIPSMIDEVPLIAAAGAFAEGVTSVRGAQELRIKESDRIKATVGGFSALGASILEKEDGFEITGSPLKGGFADSYGDHRIAMALAAAASASDGCSHISGMECSSISYPEFTETLNSLSI